jgi:pimeloyl-ACP methyl ester carboxylesterase
MENSLSRRAFVSAGLLLIPACAAPKLVTATAFHSERISVETTGSGPDVILVPGLGSSPEVWAGIVRSIPGYRYHLVQLNGFAGRPAAGNASGPVIAPAAEELARYIREVRLDRPAIIGHSMGGTIALSLAARHDVASKVMVVDMLPFLGVLFGPPGTTAESVRATADALRDRGLRATPEERRSTVEASIATMVRDEALRAAPIRHALTSDRGVAARAYHELIITDLQPELSRIAAPVTVLYVKTPNVPLTEAQFDAVYAAAYAPLPRVALKRIPGSYHFIMYDAPARFENEITAFLGRSGRG